MKDDEKKEKKKYKFTTKIARKGFLAELVVDGDEPFFCRYDTAKGTTTMLRAIDDYLPYYVGADILQFVKFPRQPESYGSEQELIDEIRGFIRKWVDLPELYEKICAYYVLLTWSYDHHRDLPYLRVLADLGSGKSRLGVDVMGNLCYKSIPTMAVSSISSLFRVMHDIGGTIILDEADLGDDSEKTSDIVQMLNSGYKKGVPLMRTVMGQGGQGTVRAFNVFGPKVILSREHMKDVALESRFLPIKLVETKRTDIPLFTDQSLEDEGLELRNKLLQWRFDGWAAGARPLDKEFLTMPISTRLKQLFLILSSVISDQEIIAELKDYALSVNTSAGELRSDSFEGDVVEAIHSLALMSNLVDGRVCLSFVALTDEVNAKRTEAQKKVTTRGVGRCLRESLSLETGSFGHDNIKGLRALPAAVNAIFGKFNLKTIPFTESQEIQF